MTQTFSLRPGVPVQNPAPIWGCDKTFSIDLTTSKRVLITGKDSFIGNSLMSYAAKHYPNLSFDVLDMRSAQWAKHDFGQYDSVFHVAGLAHLEIGARQLSLKEQYYQVNTDLAIQVAKQVKQAHVKQFIFMSSMSIYGASAPYGKLHMITRQTLSAPVTFYGDSKWQADKAVRDLESPSFHVAVLRPPMVYGNGAKGNYPLLQKLAHKLPIFPNVQNQRSMIYIDNLCEFVCQLILSGENGIYFPQNPEYTRTAQMVALLGQAEGKKIHLLSILNPFVKLASYVPGKMRTLVNKAFGNCAYAQDMSSYKGLTYQKYDLKGSIQGAFLEENSKGEESTESYPPFSALMSVYAKDRPAWVRQALDSVLSNTVKPNEVIIMVDGPIGVELRETLEQIAKNPLVRVIYHPVNVGRGAALAVAVPQCKDELIALVDADDISLPDRFEKQLKAFIAQPDLAVVGGQVQELEAESLTPLAQRHVPLTNTEIRKYLKTRMPVNNPTIMFKKQVVLDSGNFQAFGLLEDYYMWVRIAAKGYQMANVPDILVNMRVNAALYGRRGGYKYFCMNKMLFDKMRQLHLINTWEYCYILSIRFVVQVLMPNSVRSYFYRKALR